MLRAVSSFPSFSRILPVRRYPYLQVSIGCDWHRVKRSNYPWIVLSVLYHISAIDKSILRLFKLRPGSGSIVVELRVEIVGSSDSLGIEISIRK